LSCLTVSDTFNGPTDGRLVAIREIAYYALILVSR
jgi:hypothetical protein